MTTSSSQTGSTPVIGPHTEQFRLIVNGAERSVTCEPDTPLLDVLRHDLGLTGPKFGCGMGLCGACMVLIEGHARASCDLPVSAVGGPVITVEGLPGGGRLHPVQQAFVDEQAAQCGYCTSGMVMAAAGLLRDRPAPTEQEAREALDGNLCRCGTHDRIIRAVQKAAAQTSGGSAVVPRPPAGQVLASQVPAGGTHPAAGPVLAPPSGSPSPLVAESGVPARRLPAAGRPCGEPGAGPVAGFQPGWGGHDPDRQGGVRPGHLDRAGAGSRGGTSGRAGPGAGGSGVHQHQPQRGCHGGQPVGRGLRLGAAAGVRQARGLLLAAAAARLGGSDAALAVADGQIRAADRPTGLSYWTLAAPGMLDRPADVPVPSRPPGEWSVAGRSSPRLDFPGKVTGRPRFLHDLVLPGMVYGRVVRPPARAAELTGLADTDLGPESVLVRDGSFLGVVAETDRAARLAAGRVARAAQWQTAPSLPDPGDLRGFLLSAPSEDQTVVDQRATAAEGTATRTLAAEFTRPFLAHASAAPSCAIARWDGGSVTVWCHSQGIFLLRGAIAAGLGLDAGQVTVHYVEGAGVFGQNGADDVAMDAVLLARAAGGGRSGCSGPARTRCAGRRWGKAMLARLSAGLDASEPDRDLAAGCVE